MIREFAHYVDVLRASPRPFRFVAGRLLARTGLSRYFIIDQSGGYRLRFSPSNLAEQLWVNPRQRDEALAFFTAFLKPGDVVVDVGANIGDTSIVAARAVGPNGHVHSFEPHPRVFGWLEDNVRLNALANVSLSNMALGERSGAVVMSDGRRDDMNRVVPDSGAGISVPIKALDELMAAIPRIDLLKIDVEGFELFVLKGAAETLSRTAAVHVEIAQEHFGMFGYGVGDVLGLLTRSGFKLFRFVSARDLERITETYLPQEVENIIGVRDVQALLRVAGTRAESSASAQASK